MVRLVLAHGGRSLLDEVDENGETARQYAEKYGTVLWYVLKKGEYEWCVSRLGSFWFNIAMWGSSKISYGPFPFPFSSILERA